MNMTTTVDYRALTCDHPSMAVEAGVERGAASSESRARIRARFGFARDPETIDRLTRDCPVCFALPARWCKAGFGRRFSDATGFLHEER